MPDASPSQAAVRELYDRYIAGDMQTVLASMADDVRWGSCGIPGTGLNPGESRGIQGVRDYFAALQSAWVIERYEVLEIIGDQERFAVHCLVRARHKSTGRLVECEKVDLLTVRDGRIQTFQEIVDTAPIERAAAG